MMMTTTNKMARERTMMTRTEEALVMKKVTVTQVMEI